MRLASDIHPAAPLATPILGEESTTATAERYADYKIIRRNGAVVGFEPDKIAVAMTKAQKNSSTPTDSGLYRRETDGRWVHFGPRILGIGSVAAQPGFRRDHSITRRGARAGSAFVGS